MKKNGTLNQKFNFDKQKHHNIIIGQMQFFFFFISVKYNYCRAIKKCLIINDKICCNKGKPFKLYGSNIKQSKNIKLSYDLKVTSKLYFNWHLSLVFNILIITQINPSGLKISMVPYLGATAPQSCTTLKREERNKLEEEKVYNIINL